MARSGWIPGIVGATASVAVVLLASRVEAPAALTALASAAAATVLLAAWAGERAGARDARRDMADALRAQRPEVERRARAAVEADAGRLARRILGLANAETSVATADAWAWREAATTAASLVSLLEPQADRGVGTPCRK